MKSLNTRVTVYSLAIFVLSIWSLALYTGRMLQNDLQEKVGEQQFSTATIVAEEIDQELIDRLHGLARIAERIPAYALNNSGALNALLEANPLFMEMFNAGAFITDARGTAIASVPESTKRVGLNYMDRDHIEAALKDGRASVGEPVMGQALRAPVVSIAVPVRDIKGIVIGSLVGVTNLNQSNFMDRILGHRYGSSGGYALIDAKHRRIVTATDKSYVLKPTAPAGVRPIIDRYIEGFEGFGVGFDARGIESLTASHRIKAANWMVLVLLPTDEAYAPIYGMQRRMFYFATILTLTAGISIWWILRRQLDPLRQAAMKLASLHGETAFPEHLPVTRDDEIGLVMGGFNQLLASLRSRETSLQQSEERFRTLVSWTPEAIAVHAQGKILFVNPAAIRLLGAPSSADLVGRSILDFVHPDFHGAVLTRTKAVMNEGQTLPAMEEKFLQLDGTAIDVEVQAIAIQYNGQPASQVAMYDITERKANERLLRQLSRITEQSPIAIVITDLQGSIEYVNPRFEEVTGYSAAEVLGKNPRVLKSGTTSQSTYENLWRTVSAGQVWRGEFFNRKKNGEDFVEQAVIAPVLSPGGGTSHYVALKEDITLRKQSELKVAQLLVAQENSLQRSMQSEAALQVSVKEKTALLNEVHHRVKNNLQVITSLLRLEEGRTSNLDTRTVLREMQGRIRSMAIVHETLYRSGTFAEVDLHTYIGQVASNAFRALAGGHGNVRLVLALLPVRAGIEQATPCGLLVNELVSNALKHAFNEGQGGEVRVSLQTATDAADGAHRWCLAVSDTGTGLPIDFDARRLKSLGMQLVSDLCKQLAGNLTIDAGPGARFTLTFTILVAAATATAKAG